MRLALPLLRPLALALALPFAALAGLAAMGATAAPATPAPAPVPSIYVAHEGSVALLLGGRLLVVPAQETAR